MKKFFKYFLLSQILLTFYFCGYAQVGIGTNTPHASAKLEVSSTTQGFLPPRVSLTSTNAASPVTSPETGLLVYNIAPNGSGATAVTPGFYYWGGSAWVRLIVPTDNAANVTATVAVANGGTGATTLTGILKGNGTSAFTAAVAGTDYQAPISGTTNYLPKVTGAGTVGNSQVFDNGTSVGIGTNNPNSNAILDLTSSSKGLLLPRLTLTQRNTISSVPEGMIIFNTTSGAFEVYGKNKLPERINLSFFSESSPSLNDEHNAWQAFTPTITGYLSKITLKQRNPNLNPSTGSYEVEMRLYSGVTGSNGSLLEGGRIIGHSAIILPAVNSPAPWLDVDYIFSNPPFVVANTKYYFQTTTISPLGAYTGIQTHNTDVYANHDTWVGGSNKDLLFNIYIQPLGASGWISIN